MLLDDISENSQLECNGKTVIIKRYISNGATANVFEGEYDGQTVAIKAIRSSATSGYRSEFLREAQTMQMLWNQWEKRYPQQPQVVPCYIGGDPTGERPFIVEEFIAGQNIARAIRDLPNGVFSELQALQVAAQIGRMLVVLHEDLKTCYGDIKFKNFMIVGNLAQANPQLKVIDWNVLSSYKPENVARELLYISTYLVFMLTSISVAVNEEQNTAVLAPDTSEALKKLTFGTEQFLRTALHSDPSARFQTAQDWLAGVEQLIAYWNTDSDELVKSVSDTLSSMGLEKDYESIYMAKKMIAVAIAKGARPAEDLLAKLNEALGIDNLVEQIKHQLESNNADMAARIYRTVMNKVPYNTDERVVLWGCVSIAAETIMPDYSFMRLQKAVEERLAGQWVAAKDNFLLTGDTQRAQGLIDLMNEASVHEMILNAENQEIEYRKDTLHQVVSLYDSLPDSLKRLVRAKNDPLQMAAEAQATYEQIIMAQQLCDQAAREVDAKNALAKWEKALSVAPVANPKIFIQLQKQVVAYLNRGQYEEAEYLAGLPRLFGQHCSWCELAVKAARELHNLQVNITQVGPGQQIVQEINQYEERSKQIPEKERSELFLSQGFQILIEKVFTSALNAQLFTVAEPLRQMALRMHFENSQSLDQKYIEEWKKFCKNLYKQVEDRLNQPLSDDNFSIIERMLYGLPDKDLDVLSSDFLALQNRVNVQRINYNKQKELFAEEQKHKKAMADQLLVSMGQARDKYERLEQAVLISPVEAAPALRPEMTRQLFSYVAALLSWHTLVKDSPDYSELEAWVDQKIRGEDLVSFEILVKTKYPELKKAIHDGIDAALREGREKDVMTFLSGMSEGDYPEERKKVKDIQDFLAWSQALREGSDDPISWLTKGIPPVYWQRGACAYFDKKAENLLAGFQLGNLAKLAQSRLIGRRLGSNIPAAPQPASSWKAVVEAAQALNQYKNVRKRPATAAAMSSTARKSRHAGKPVMTASTQPTTPQPDTQALKDELLNRIDNLPGWDVISTQPVKPQAEKAASGRGWMAFAIVTGLFVVALATVLGLTLAGVLTLGPITAQTPPPAVTSESNTPTPDRSVSGEITESPGATVSAEPASTLAPTPLPTNTPLPTPTSVYALGVYGAGAPPLPDGITWPMYLIDDPQAAFSEKDWKVIPDLGINDSMHMVDSTANTEDDQAEWKLDQPLSKDGLYEIYILDTVQKSGTTNPISYQVFTEETDDKILAEPLRGNRSIKLLFNNEQKDNLWRSIGIYDLKAGQLISVTLIVPKNTLKGNDTVGADAVLIASLPSYDTQSGPAKDLDQKGRRVLFVIDESQARFTPELVEGWEEKESLSPDGSIANVWDGKFHQINVTKDTGEVSVEWIFAHPLPAGEYDLQVFIPQEMVVAADFQISLDGKPLDATTFKTVTLTKDAGAQGSHFPQEPWKIIVPEGSQGMLVIKVTAAKDVEGVFACDAAVLSILK